MLKKGFMVYLALVRTEDILKQIQVLKGGRWEGVHCNSCNEILLSPAFLRKYIELSVDLPPILLLPSAFVLLYVEVLSEITYFAP